MPVEPITLIKGDKLSIETDYRDNLPVNMYAVKRDILGAQGYMIEYPGLRLLGNVNGIDRGAIYNDRIVKHFRVSGDKLIEVSPGGVETQLGTISGTEQVSLPYSFQSQVIIADQKMYRYTTSLGLVEVTDPDLGKPIDCVWINGYYFLTDGESIYHTDITDETSIDPLKFATSEFSPDPTLGVSKTQDNIVVVWNRNSVEYFKDIAQTNFAFTRLENRAQKIGIVATHAKTEHKGTFYILGGEKDGSIFAYAVGTGSNVKISTREIDRIIEQYNEEDLKDVRVESRYEKDVSFILMHLPNETLCYNVDIANTFGKEYAWSILQSDINGSMPYRGINGVFDGRSGQWVYGDKREGKIGTLDETSGNHYGDKTEWILFSPLLDLERFSIDQLSIDTITGHTSVDDATVAFSVTYDGVIFSSEYWSLYGTPYNYNLRFFLRRLGSVNNWIGFKFRGAASSRYAFAKMEIEYN